MSIKGTLLTMINLTRLGPGSTSPYGTYVGLGNAKSVSISFRGSYSASAGTTAVLDIYAAYKTSPGSVDTNTIGSIVLAAAANSVKQRSKADFGSVDLAKFPFIVAKIRHRTGTVALGAILARAFVKHE